MLKIMGVILVIGSFTGIGMTQRQHFRRRVVVLGELLCALDLISAELSYHLTSIPELVGKLAADKRRGISCIFRPMQELMEQDDGLSLTYKWMKAVRAQGEEAGLAPEDITVLCDLSAFIGRYDVQAQLEQIAHARTQLSANLELASAEMKNKGNVYRTCCVAAGILLVLVLL